MINKRRISKTLGAKIHYKQYSKRLCISPGDLNCSQFHQTTKHSNRLGKNQKTITQTPRHCAFGLFFCRLYYLDSEWIRDQHLSQQQSSFGCKSKLSIHIVEGNVQHIPKHKHFLYLNDNKNHMHNSDAFCFSFCQWHSLQHQVCRFICILFEICLHLYYLMSDYCLVLGIRACYVVRAFEIYYIVFS